MGCVIKYKGQSIPEEQFLQYLNKQIAINNLFNENESLANAVYEAAGFKTNYDNALEENKKLLEDKKIHQKAYDDFNNNLEQVYLQQKQQAQQLYQSFLDVYLQDILSADSYFALEEILVVNKIIDRKCS